MVTQFESRQPCRFSVRIIVKICPKTKLQSPLLEALLPGDGRENDDFGLMSCGMTNDEPTEVHDIADGRGHWG